MNDIRAFVGFYRAQRRFIVISTAVSFLSSFVEAGLLLVLVPLAQALITPAAAPVALGPIHLDADPDRLLLIALVLALLTAVGALIANSLSVHAAAAWQRTTRMRLFRAFQSASWEAQSRERTSKLLTTTVQSVNQGAGGLAQLINGLGSLISLVVLVATSFLVAPLGAALMFVGGAILFALLRPLGHRAKRLNKELAGLNKTVNGEMTEWIGFARDVRVFDVAAETDTRLDALVERHEQVRRTTMTMSGALTPLYRFGGILLVLFVVFVATRVDAVTAASLGAAALLIYRSLGYGQGVQRASHAIHEVLPFLVDIDEDLRRYEADTVASGDEELGPLTAIAYRNVGYRYDERDAALHDVSLDLEVGEIVGIVGPSGSGKSTLAQLLLRLREPSEGTMEVDGIDVRRFSAGSWHRRVALVPQEAHLLHGTVADNIAFLRPWVDRASVERAAIDAGVHAEILALPHGYDTHVGATSRDLSGGQVQRISIARALAGQPSVLVLDEPTSALDVHSEAIVQKTLDLLRERLLVVIIAHRLTTLSICDRLVVLRSGSVELTGPTADVMASSSFFDLAPTEP